MAFDKKIETVLAEYHQRMTAERELMQSLPLEEGIKRRDEFLLSVGEDVGRFLNAMVKGAGSTTILEIGISYGYSRISPKGSSQGGWRIPGSGESR